MSAKTGLLLPELLTEVRLATPSQLQGIPLSLPQGMTREQASTAIGNEALRWTYVLRSRRRWVGGTRVRERNEHEAREALKAIGVDEAELQALGNSDRIVVRVPYISEKTDWQARIFPWEYVLAAATREHRVQAAGTGRPRALTVMRELQRQPPQAQANAERDGNGEHGGPLNHGANQRQGAAPMFVDIAGVEQPSGDRLQVIFVECLPSELREHWSLDSEKRRLKAVLPKDTLWHVLSYPTLKELCEAVAERRPQLLHFAGLDSHQGLRELRLHFGIDVRVDLGPHTARIARADDAEGSTGAGASIGTDGAADADGAAKAAPGDSFPYVDAVTADSGLMVDGVILRGENRRVADRKTEAGYPRLVRAHELALALRATGHQTYLTSFNLWNSAARLAPLVVAEGAALAAVGFQDAFDDSLADFVHSTLIARLIDTGWNLPQAFEDTWRTVRDLPESVDATGITLWAGAPLLQAAPSRPVSGSKTAFKSALRAVDSVPAEGTPAREMPPTIHCDIKPFPELNYAVLHNAQPLFERFVLECDAPGEDVLLDVEVAVHMGSETACFKRRVVMRHCREALTRVIHVPLTASIARAVREAISSSLSVEVRHGEHVLYCDTHRLRLLPVDQWRDNRRDGRWLPSFVQPRDPAVAGALEMAQRYNRVLRDDPNAGFEGYQLALPGDEESLRSVDRQVEAIWATLLHDWRLGYINPPPTYSGTLDSQRLRMPASVLRHRAGTCIDLALLFAACLELIDVYPVIFLLEGHALPGWWRHPSFRDEYFEMPAAHFAEVVHASATENTVANAQVVAWHTGSASWPEVRRWIRERKLVPIETVRLTESCSFVEAIEAGVTALGKQRDFDSMLEIITARMEQVTPLPMLEVSA